ncbi:nuclear fragile X mental retardation-interacting protein 1 [Glossina fuscipes]|uniref:Nuclear fragile X mental retardation-interacting protein 1 n=1 Tax=Glossina fuscipes TaxID=7396 RepID=A0A9C5ZE72_9MUSC|nr:nuclear fragile X mental retardation-interacting protein 1 [Glossina fuscipes]KAI9578431.1 hypothetical protein GQX74_009005 [Glossina fuscipes]
MESEKPAKRLLPSPNFSWKEKETNIKTKNNFLPSSAISLLKSRKHGSTYPDEYSDQSSNTQINEIRKTEKQHCESCELDFQSPEDLKVHRLQHEKCPVDSCKFWGHSTIMDKHVLVLHSSGLFDKFKKLSTPEEIATWREERRRRYPTVANVLLKQKALEQKQKRGERLEINKSRFGRAESRKRTKPWISKENSANEDLPRRSNFKKRRKQQKDTKPKSSNVKTKLHQPPKQTQEQIEHGKEDLRIVCAFEGTAKMEDYKHFSQKRTNANVLYNLLGMYGSDSESENCDNEASVQPNCSNSMCIENVATSVSNNNECVNSSEGQGKNASFHVKEKGNASQNLTTNFETDSKQNVIAINAGECTAENEDRVVQEDLSPKFNQPTTQNAKVKSEGDFPQRDGESSDGAPEECPIQHSADYSNMPLKVEDKVPQQAPSFRREQRKKKPAFNLNKVRLRKQNTMLEKLLEPDIRHERNLLLQCVRFVCEHNFFGIGQISK